MFKKRVDKIRGNYSKLIDLARIRAWDYTMGLVYNVHKK